MNNQFEKMQKLAFGKVITESNPQSLTESSLKDKIKELVHSSLGEAKKKKKKEADVAPQEDTVDMDIGMDMDTPSDTIAPTSTDEIDIDPKVKTIQDSLSKALANAKALGDEKLVNQIGNTITMLVRTQVVGQQQVAEMQGDPEDFGKWDDGHHQSQYAEENDENPVVKDYIDLLKGYIDDIYDVYNIIKAVESIKTGVQQDKNPIIQDYINLLIGYIDDQEDIDNLTTAVAIIKKDFGVKENIYENDIFNNTYKVSDEVYRRMDSLVDLSEYNAFIESATNIMRDLVNEGFEVKDIFYYLYTRLTADV